MIVGNIARFNTSGLTSEKLAAYLEILGGISADTADGRYELDGGAFYVVQTCKQRPREGAKFESHKKYIDIQYIVDGVEDMEAADISTLTLTDEYDEAGDYMLFEGKGALLHFEKGDFAVYFPEDGHMPAIGNSTTRKVVVKIPV